jgi:hypothetical protein
MPRFLAHELPRVLLRLLAAVGIYVLIGAVRWPAGLAPLAATAGVGLLAGAILVICGKFLFDTLYYDHYWRQLDSRQ